MRRPAWPTRIVTASIALALAGCSSTPTEQRTAASGARSGNDPTASYARSRTEAPPVPVFQEFGLVEGNRLTLRVNQSLLDEQAREVCDNKPYLATANWTMPRCVVPARLGCDRYDMPPGQPQPPCVIPIGGACMRRAEPTPPPPRYDYTKDCYRALPDSSVAGQIDVYAVPEATAPNRLADRGTKVGSFRLAMDGTPLSMVLPDIPADQCFGLADASGKPIGLRGNDPGRGSHLFASANLTASRTNAALEEAVKQKEALLVRAQGDLGRASRALAASTAWKNKQCVAPPQEALPARPEILPDSAIEMHSKAYCLLLLNDQFNEDIVAKGARAQQKYSFIKAAQAVKFDVTRTAECTHRYSYSPRDLAYLRGEHIQQNTTNPGLAGILEGMFKGIDQQIRVTQEQRFRMIGSMLESCYGEARSSCRAPQVAWEGMVADIRARPQRIKAQCETDRAQAQAEQQAVRDAEQALAAAKAAVTAQRAAPSQQAVRLSQAVCRTQ